MMVFTENERAFTETSATYMEAAESRRNQDSFCQPHTLFLFCWADSCTEASMEWDISEPVTVAGWSRKRVVWDCTLDSATENAHHGKRTNCPLLSSLPRSSLLCTWKVLFQRLSIWKGAPACHSLWEKALLSDFANAQWPDSILSVHPMCYLIAAMLLLGCRSLCPKERRQTRVLYQLLFELRPPHPPAVLGRTEVLLC